MSGPCERPSHEGPDGCSRAARLPPAGRSRVALGLTAAAALGRFELQVCDRCGAVQYPPREACHRCLCVELRWKLQSGAGELISETTLHHSHEGFFRERLPWRIGMVRLDCGPTVVAHLHSAVSCAPSRVRIEARLDKAAQAVLIGLPPAGSLSKETANMADDRQLRELGCDPSSRKVLVTEGKSVVGQALVRALVSAGADVVWVGFAGSSEASSGLVELARLTPVRLVPLDMTCSDSVRELGARIGAQIQILINNAESHGSCGLDAARMQMDVNYFGLLRLAEEFAPVMCARGVDGQSRGVAWVNLLSVCALSSDPSRGTYAASMAAAHSLSQWLRARMQPAGIRVVSVFPGPLDGDSSWGLSLPKLAPAALARSVVKALQEGAEDVFPGDVAQEWLALWRENPKILERELAMRR